MKRVYPNNVYDHFSRGVVSISAIKFTETERPVLAVYDGNNSGSVDVYGEFYDQKSADEFMEFLRKYNIVEFAKGGDK